VSEGEKQRARTEVRRAQAEFERAQERVQRERAKARAARRERFAQAQKDGLTVRDIADETGLDYSHVAEIIRGK
jgi:molecular chaperone GrpE (heat shock protein)